MSSETKLWNGSFLAACITNFFYQFGRYFLVPIIALYLIDTWQANKTEVGFVLAGFSVSMMIIRPFCGFLADTLDRRRLYRGALVAFAAIFFAYPFAATMTTFAALQIAHGFALGVLAVIANTLVIDITPSQRRGEALGFYGIMNNIAMALAPMMAIWIHHHFGYPAVFILAAISAFVALLTGMFVKGRKNDQPRIERSVSQSSNGTLLSLDRFILINGLPAGANMLLLAIPYGMITSYIALYSQQLQFGLSTGVYFLCMGVGIILSRFFGGKWVDQGRLTNVCSIGGAIATLSVFLLAATGILPVSITSQHLLFDCSALLTGLGYGLIFPSMNTLFVNLARHDQRGTASATYMTTWDVGIGAGMLFGGMLADVTPFAYVFLVGAVCALLSSVLWHTFTMRHYLTHRLS